MTKILLAAVLAGLSNLASADVAYYVDLTDNVRRITSFEIAKPGSSHFRPVLVNSHPFADSGNTVTIVVRESDGSCLRDLRIGFADGSRVVQHDFDLCALPGYRIGQELLLATQP
jgi:hypothetical protein